MSNLRLELVFKPNNLLTAVGIDTYILPYNSYLRILNSVQLIKVNISNKDLLKIGQSFYIYFYFTGQYLSYDAYRGNLRLTHNLNQRTQFKILTDKFDWNSRGDIQIGNLFKYRILLAEENSRVLTNQNGKAVASRIEDNRSLVSFQQSIYVQDSISYPIKLTSIQSNLALCLKNKKTFTQKKPSICQYMVSIEKKPGSQLYAIRHPDSNSYLVKSGKQFLFMKDAPLQLKYCLRIRYYDSQQSYLVLETLDHQYLQFNPDTKKCQCSSNLLQNVIIKEICTQQSIKNILISAWLKAELPLPSDQSSISFIFDECQTTLQQFREVYKERVVEDLISQGLFQDLQFISSKYSWNFVGPRICKIVKLMLQIKKCWVIHLFQTPNLYKKLMTDAQIIKIIQMIRVNREEVTNPDKVLKDVQKLIFKQKQISQTTLQTLLVVSPLIYNLGTNEEHKQLKQFVQFACSKIVPQLKKKSISSFFSIGLKLIKTNTTPAFFNTQVMGYLSLDMLQNQNLKLEDKLILLQMFEGQTGPYVYICSEDQTIRSIAHQKKNEKTLAFYIQDILPKNCSFQTYQNKLISVSLVTYHLKVNQILEISDCKQYTKYLIDTINSYNYEQSPTLFLKNALQSFLNLIDRVLILACDRSYQFDSVTPLISERITKSKLQIEGFINQQVLNLPIVWNLFEKQKTIQENQQAVFLSMLKICQKIVYPQKKFTHLFQLIKLNEELSPYLIKAISLFLRRQYEFDPIRTSEKLTSMLKQMQQEQYIIIATLISQNNLYEKLCFKSEYFYKIINIFGTVKIVESNILDGQKILKILNKRRGNWLYCDNEFNFFRNLLDIIGGVVNMQIYESYKKYICGVQPQKWTLQFFRLCRNFFLNSPITLRRKFVVSYHYQLKSENECLKLQKLFVSKGSDFIVSYMKLLLSFSDFHSSKQLIYEIMGDQALFNILFQFSSNIQLRIKILELMVKTRKRFNQFQLISANPLNTQWLKKGNHFIRQKLGNQNSTKSDASQLVYLKDYTCALLDFLQMREQIRIHTQISEDQALVVQGTNKIFAFKLAQLIGYTIKNDTIQKNIFDKIQWFQNQYKIGIDTVELTHISDELQKQQIKSSNFEYNYMLKITPQVEKSVQKLLTLMNIEVFVTILIKITLSLSFQSNIDESNLQIVLNYLHYFVTNKTFNYTQKDLQLLFLAMHQLALKRQLNFVALMQNSIRKAMLVKGQLQTRNQIIIQQNILKYEGQIFQYINQCITNYTTFSPLYESTLNYFNRNGQKSICWSVSCYISTLRFLITLTKSLQLKFKQIFTINQINNKQIIGSLIQVNKKHIKQIFKDTSDAKLTIIAYQIQLINNLILGPVDTNIKAALKFKYQQIVDLIKLPDMHDNPERLNSLKIIVHIKKIVADAILILAPFHKFNKYQIKIIEQGLIVYYRSTSNLVNDDLNIVVQKYNKNYKNQLQVMNFDLCLNLFFCIIRIYQKDGNTKIKQMRTDALRKIRLVKTYNKRFKMFYQIYRIFVQLIAWLGRCFYKCFKKTANQLQQAVFGQSQATHQQNLNKVFAFFVKNVSSVQIQVAEEIQIVYFLLMKETKYYNNSIRKQLHRNVGLGDREFRLTKFMEQTNHVILRLQTQMSVRKVTQKYKPIELIIKNRQLWKSMNFLCACLLNLIFLAQGSIANPEIPLYILRAMSFIFCIFLFMIYFIQSLPLKRRLVQQMSKGEKPQKLKSFLVLLNDKTLWFATIYFIIISLSIYRTGFVAILMVDFFVRFKISKKVTQIVTRPFATLFLIVLVSVMISFIYTYYLYFIGQTNNCQNIAACVQQTYYAYLGLYKNLVGNNTNISLQYRNITQFIATFIAITINNSLIIGVLLYQKKAKDTKNKEWQEKVKQRCFICNIERNIIDRSRNNNKGFFQHIEEQQNLWGYVYYLIYLKNKQLESLNIIQSMVLKQWKNYRIDWLPKAYRT